MVRLGQRLHDERLHKKLSLDEIASATKIKARFLAAIERGEYHKLPSPTYAKGFVTNYAAYLGLPRTEVVALFKREFDEKKAYKVLPESFTKTKEFPLKRIRLQESLIVAAGMLLVFVSYMLFQYRSLFFPPPLFISSPQQDIVTSQEVTVTGRTDSNVTVLVNNEPTFLNSAGEFSKNITLFPGKTAIIVEAKNKFGKETVVKREIVVK